MLYLLLIKGSAWPSCQAKTLSPSCTVRRHVSRVLPFQNLPSFRHCRPPLCVGKTCIAPTHNNSSACYYG